MMNSSPGSDAGSQLQPLQRQNTPTGHFAMTQMLSECYIDDLPKLQERVTKEIMNLNITVASTTNQPNSSSSSSNSSSSNASSSFNTNPNTSFVFPEDMQEAQSPDQDVIASKAAAF